MYLTVYSVTALLYLGTAAMPYQAGADYKGAKGQQVLPAFRNTCTARALS